MNTRLNLIGILIICGLGWGLTIPMTKIAVSTGYEPYGLIFWQVVISGLALSAVLKVKGQPLPFAWGDIKLYLIIACLGTIFPNAATYVAATKLPAGVMSIIISLVPMAAFPMALMLGTDRYSHMRLLGLICGLAAVVVLSLADLGLPGRDALPYLAIALIAPFFYGFEGNYVAKWGTRGLSAIQVLAGASWVTAIVVLPVAFILGHWINPLKPWGAPDYALVFSALLHAFAYTVYVWLVGRAGAVFTAQVSYLVTLFGVLAAMVILGEIYAGGFWVALALMLAGLFLVKPRHD